MPLIEDDVYGELYFGGKRPLPAKAFDTEGLVMHCSSFSKCLAPGYRIGWAAPGRFARAVARAQADHHPGRRGADPGSAGQLPGKGRLRQAPAQAAARRWPRSRRCSRRPSDDHFPAGTRATRPAGGYFLWVELPPSVECTGDCSATRCRSGISVAPGPIFSAQRGFTNCLRLNYGPL